MTHLRLVSDKRHFRKLHVEQLEQRVVLVLFWASFGEILSWTGNADAELLRDIHGLDGDGPGPLPATVWFKTAIGGGPINTVDTGIAAGIVKQIHIFMGDGLDTVDLSDGMFNMPLIEYLWIQGEGGNDTIVSIPPGDVRHPSDPLSRRLGENIVIDGGAGDDTITGDDDPELIEGHGGLDTIEGNGDDDYIYGGNDDDWYLSGGGGHDYVYGGPGDEWIEGNDGNDHLYGNEDHLGFLWVEA